MPERPRSPTICVRPATESDLPRVIELIALGNVAGTQTEQLTSPLPESYVRALRAIKATPGLEVYVAELEGEVIGTFQLSTLPNLSNGGRPVAQLESVHVAPPFRGRGVGEQMLAFAIAESRAQGCFRLQLTSNKARADAHRFYARAGFVASHEGMKLALV
ncbi:MAG: GNAT family N-acetyltransferase [Polyangiaceae bacterium]|jgi:GNAT superfamily N-acetyltransferase|nr:GNAT family N-acetyltransferase [Polyangiaceae bacterium]